MAQDKGSAGDEPHRIVVSPNNSLGARGKLVFFLLVAVAVLLLSGTVAVRGYWPVLPFAGLELLLLAICLYLVHRRARYREVITLEDGWLRVEKGLGRPESRWKFKQAWVRVELESSPHRNHPARLFLREGQDECEIGRCLIEQEKIALCERLKGLLASRE